MAASLAPSKGILLVTFLLASCIMPCVAGSDPFGPLWVVYQDPLQPGTQDARLDLTLYLPKGYELFGVKVLFLPEEPLSTDANATIIGRMGETTTAALTFYVNVNESAKAGVYEVPVVISYKTVETGASLSVQRTIQLRVEEVIEPEDPFGYLGIATVPSVLVPGLRGAQLILSLPYVGPRDQLYDVSLYLGVVEPFSTLNGSYYLGVVSSDSVAGAVFYLDVREDAASGEYDLPLTILYRSEPDAGHTYASRVVKLFVASGALDPFGSLGVVTVPSSLVPGLRGVEVRVSLPYLGGLVDRLYDVSLSLGVADPFSTLNDTYYLGVVAPQSPIGPTPTAVFYLDVSSSAAAGIYRMPVVVSYATSEGGPIRRVNRSISIQIKEVVEAVDPFGSLIVSTNPSSLFAGLKGVGVKLSLVYIGIDERIYDVSMSLDVRYPFYTANRSYYVGMMTVQSPIADVPFGVIYLDIDKAAVSGEYDLPLSIRYRIAPDGGFRLSTKFVKLFVAGEAVDPFGSLDVVTVPSSLVPGLRGVEVRVSLPYLGGLADRLYDVSLSLGVADPFSTLNDTYYLGVVAPQSPIGPTPLAIFYLDVADPAQPGEYGLPLSVRYRLGRDGELKSCAKSLKLAVAGEAVDPFGSLDVVTVPSSLVPGLRGVEVRVSLPYLGGLVDRLYDVSLSLGVGDPFSSVNDTYYLGVMSPQSPIGPTPEAVFYLDVAESVGLGEYDVPLLVRYRLTREGELSECLRTIKLAITDPDPVWVVKGISDRLRPGSTGTVSVIIENHGGSSRSVTAQFIPELPGLVKPEDGTLYIGDFGVNESKKVVFPVVVESGVSGNQLVTIRIEYSADGARISESHSITLRIGGIEGPSLMLGQVSMSSEPAIGGEFDVVLKIDNVGSEEAEAGLIDLSLPSSLAVVGSGSTMQAGSIAPGESKTVRFKLAADSGASEGTLNVAYLLQWSNAEGEKSQRQGSFGVTLKGEPRLVIQRIDIDPPKIESNARGTFQVTVRNSGTQAVSDITIQLLGSPELFTETVLPIGSLLPKQTDSVVFGLFADPKLKAGTFAITVSLTYLDASGQEHEETALVDVKVHRRISIFSGVGLAILLAVLAAVVLLYIVFGDGLAGKRQSGV